MIYTRDFATQPLFPGQVSLIDLVKMVGRVYLGITRVRKDRGVNYDTLVLVLRRIISGVERLCLKFLVNAPAGSFEE